MVLGDKYKKDKKGKPVLKKWYRDALAKRTYRKGHYPERPAWLREREMFSFEPATEKKFVPSVMADKMQEDLPVGAKGYAEVSEGEPMKPSDVDTGSPYIQGVKPNGDPYFGEGFAGLTNKIRHIWSKEPRVSPAVEALSEKDSGLSYVGKIGKFTQKAIDYGVRRPIESVIGTQFWGANSVVKLVERPLGTIGMTLEELGERSKWAALPGTETLFSVIEGEPIESQDIDPNANSLELYHRSRRGPTRSALTGTDPDKGFSGAVKALEDFNPVFYIHDAARAIEAVASGKWEHDEVVQAFRDSRAASRITYSIGRGEQMRKQEFLNRVADGVDPGLAALELEVPISEITGQAIGDPLNIVDGMIGTAARSSRISTSADEVLEAVPELSKVVKALADDYGDDVVYGALRGSDHIDEFVEAIQVANRRVGRGIEKTASEFGIFKRLGSAKRLKASARSAMFGSWLAAEVKDPDAVLTAMDAMARLASDDAQVVKQGVATLMDVVDNRAVFSEGALEFGQYMKALLDDGGKINPTKLLDGLEAVKDKGGSAFDVWRYVQGELDGAIDKIYPTIQTLIDAGEDVPLRYKLINRAANPADNVVGNTRKFIKNAVGKLYIGANPPVAARGAMYDMLQSMIDTDPTIMKYGPKKWADVAVQWLGGAEPEALTRGFAKSELEELNKLVRTETSYDDLPTFMEALLGGEGDTVAEKIFDTTTSLGGRLLQFFETKSSQAITGKATDDAMRSLLTHKTLPVDALVDAGLPEELALSLVDRILDNYGNVDTVRQSVLAGISEGSVDLFASGQWMLPEDAKILREFGIHDEVMKAIGDAENLDDAQKAISGIFDSLMEEAQQLSTRHAGFTEDIATESDSLLHINEGIAEAIEKGILPESFADESNDVVLANVQAKDAGRDAVDTIFKNISARLEAEGTEEQLRAWAEFSERYRGLYDNFGTATGRNRNVMRDAARLTDAIRDADDKVALIKEAWKRFNIKADIPKNANDAVDLMWRYLLDDQKLSFQEARRSGYLGLEQMLDEGTELFGDIFADSVRNNPAVRRAQLLENQARRLEEAVMVNGEMKTVGSYITAMMDTKEAARALADFYDLAPYSANLDNYILEELSEFLDEGVASLDDITTRELYEALEAKRASEGFPRKLEQLEDLIGFNKKGNAAQRISKILSEAKRGFAQSADDFRVLREFVGEDVPTDEILEAATRKLEEMEDGVGAIETLIPPYDGSTPSARRHVYESRDTLDAVLTRVQNMAGENWGRRALVDADEDIVKALDDWFVQTKRKVGEARIVAQNYADGMRDFALHNYGDRYGIDALIGSMFNFHFWPSRTAKKWLTTRVWQHPGLLGQYTRYREYMEKIHADAPDWWKYAINTNELLGLNMENPLYFRLENMFQPIYLAGTADFNDPQKRINWWTKAIDDANKYMPGYMGPMFQYGIAVGLKAKGEQEAAARWAGDLLPASNLITGLTSLMGIRGGRGINIDPSQAIFSGGLGPYEKQRVATTLGKLALDGKYTEEELIDAAYTHSGPAWEEAVAMQRRKDAVGTTLSFFTGINTRARSEYDLAVNQFWSDYFRLWSESENHPPEWIRRNMESLRAKYDFMDTVLLARKGDRERDTAFAYSTLSRVQPGKTDDLSRAYGFDYDIISKFYDNKGDLSAMPGTDRDRFMSFILDTATSLAIPNDATRIEWGEASKRYSEMMAEGEKLYGDNIWEMVDAAYAQKAAGMNADVEFQNFLEQNPKVEDVMEWKKEYILSDPILSSYYGGIDTLRQYYLGKMYSGIEKELGDDIWDKWSTYYAYRDGGQKEKAKQFFDDNPELEEYRKRKKELMEQVDEKIVEFGRDMPEGEPMELRDDFVPQSAGQQDIAEFMQAPNVPQYSLSQWQMMLDSSFITTAKAHYEGATIPQDVKDAFNTIAQDMGLTFEELMISIGEAQ